MKTLPQKGIRFLGTGMLLWLWLPAVQAQPGVRISFETFYEELAPYGTWVDNPDYGYVWVPDVPADFQPYATDGHWVMTNYGNTWVSDYAWGWAPFHYGRWYLDDYYGWAWVPGTTWGPAWVAWRSGGGYYGWAPLGPGITISVNIGRFIPEYHWVFVRQRYFCRPNLFRYCLPRRRVYHIVHQTTIINNTYVYNTRPVYYTGPRVTEVERVTRQRIPVYQVSRAARPGRGEVRQQTLSLYRPSVRVAREGAAPRQVVSQTEARTRRSLAPRQSAVRATPYDGSPSRTAQPRSSRSEATYGNRSISPNGTRSSGSSERFSRQTPASRTRDRDRDYDAADTRSSRSRNQAEPYRAEPYQRTAPASRAAPGNRGDYSSAPRARPSAPAQAPSGRSRRREISQPTQRYEAPARQNSRSSTRRSAPSYRPSRQSAPAQPRVQSRSSSERRTSPASRSSGSRGTSRPPRNQ